MRNITCTQSPVRKCFQKAGLSTLVLLVASLLPGIHAPGKAADRIILSYNLLEFSITSQELDQFIETGAVNGDLRLLAQRFSAQQLAQTRQQLQQKVEIGALKASRLAYHPTGEAALRQIGDIVQTESRENGGYALRAAIISAAATSNSIILHGLIQKFPGQAIRIDLQQVTAIAQTLAKQAKEHHAEIAKIEQMATRQTGPSRQFSDFRQAGQQPWRKTSTLVKLDTSSQPLPVDLYLPAQSSAQTSPAPLIIISHGLAQRRLSFAYLAQHLASHGFAVVVPEYSGSGYQRIRQYLNGEAIAPSPQELLTQSRDLTALLNALEQDPNLRDKIDTQRVGIIGHSLGSSAALTMAGAMLSPKQIQADCSQHIHFNPSRLLQCQAAQLPPQSTSTQDQRVKAIFIMNSLGSTLFGQQGFSQIQIPVFIVGGTQDRITPIVEEQIRPFKWLRSSHKYLALIENGTHASSQTIVRDQRLFPDPITGATAGSGENSEVVKGYIRALSIPFFKQHLGSLQCSDNQLNSSYGNALSQPFFKLTLVSQQSQLAQSTELSTAESQIAH